MPKSLMDVFPEAGMIEDKKLLEEVLLVFRDALASGGWDVEDLEQIPFTMLIPDTDISFADHTRAVTLTCVGTYAALTKVMGSKLALNRDHLIAGALLHDIGKLLEFTKEDDDPKRVKKSKTGRFFRHPFSGVALAARREIPDEVLHMIGSHSKEGDCGKRTAEAIIVHHADFACFEPFHNAV
jgi:putative nucleotidyltransferase with HDIG domain